MKHMNRRVLVWVLAVCVVVMVGSTVVLAKSISGRASGQADMLQGVDLGSVPAPSFALPDQSGATVSLTSLHGRPTVLTFFDSVCPHQDCSLMAQYINWSAQDLGKQSADVNWVALSLNPWHDTPASVQTFLKGHNVAIPMHYLLGNLTQLSPLWDGFHMQSIRQTNDIVIHTTGVFVIDAQGHERVYMDEGFDPKMLAADLKLLLADPHAPVASNGNVTVDTASTNATIQVQPAGDKMITLTATPGKFGTYSYTVAVRDTNNTPVQNATVTADLTMTDMAMAPIHVSLAPEGTTTGLYQATGITAMHGRWQAVVRVSTPNVSQPAQAQFHFTVR